MTSDRPHLEPGPDHPITVTPTGAHVTVRVGDTVLGETDDALTLQESTYPAVQYVPLTALDQSLLRRTDSSTYCPYKGEAGYYTIVTPTTELPDAVWTYDTPYPAVSEIAGHVAFYTDRVEVKVG